MSILTASSISVNVNRYGLRAPKGGCTVGGKLFKGGQFCLPYDPTNPHGLEVAEAPALQPAPAKVSIYGFVYTVAPIEASECGTVAFEMRKLSTNNHYHVLRDNFGLVSCDCPDFVWRHQDHGTMCKHGKALVDAGMIAAPSHASAVPIVKSASTPAGTRRGRFVPTPEEMAEAAQMFADTAH